MAIPRVVVIGAGIGGLAAALDLAAHGAAVVVVEREQTPGGKMGEVEVAGRRLDAGPTVLTMPWVFEEMFAAAGMSLTDQITLAPLEVLARHTWDDRTRLDLFADVGRSAEAIAAFAGPADGRRYRELCEWTRSIYRTLDASFIRASEPSLAGLIRHSARDLWQLAPFNTMWRTLEKYFHDARLRQLFGRYATYCGSSPFLAPATLMLIAHVEQRGVWIVRGGMHRLARALAAAATNRGATFRHGAEATEIVLTAGRVAGVMLANGERLDADSVIVNADVAAVAAGCFGQAVTRAVPAMPRAARSLSAVTWAVVAACSGFPLVRHNVFFSDNYAAEFEDLFGRTRLPRAPTIYICAQDRDDADPGSRPGPERLLCLVNAPPTADTHPIATAEIEQCEQRTFDTLQRCGLRIDRQRETTAVTTPTDFHRMFPATGGALYGAASHGWTASFRRPGCRSRIPGLYLAGGSVHPGPGVPTAALSGRAAAASLLSDLALTGRFGRAAMPGGTSTR